jgi:hypothetical protein
MHLERIMPRIIAGYLIAVALLFGFTSVVQTPYIDFKPPGSFWVLGISAFFAIFGISSLYLLRKGKLKREGASISKVRQEAVKKMNDPTLLSRIATRDPNAS